MWSYEKRLQFPVNIKEPNAKLAQVIISQYGGPDGEMGASMRYLSQRYSMPFQEVAGLLTDIGTEESAHKCYPSVFYREKAENTPSGSPLFCTHEKDSMGNFRVSYLLPIRQL